MNNRAITWQNQQNECAHSKTQISLGIRPVWSESSLCAQWVAKDPSFLHADSEDSDQTGRMPRLIWVFAGRTLIWLVLSCRGPIVFVFIVYSLKYCNQLKLSCLRYILCNCRNIRPCTNYFMFAVSYHLTFNPIPKAFLAFVKNICPFSLDFIVHLWRK